MWKFFKALVCRHRWHFVRIVPCGVGQVREVKCVRCDKIILVAGG